MKKIISLFQRNYEGDRLVRDEVVPGAEWVLAGEGTATEKLDGTCCMVRDGVLFKRYDAKNGKTPPPNWMPAQEPDPVTGHHPGWLPVGDGPEDKWHREGFAELSQPFKRHGFEATLELIGPKVQGNPYKLSAHILREHGSHTYGEPFVPRTYLGLKAFLAIEGIEGIVWHHPDGRMVKIKTRDFGLKWPA